MSATASSRGSPRDVAEPHQRLDAEGGADGEHEPAQLGAGSSSRSGASASSIQPIARPVRSGSASWCAGVVSRDRRSIARISGSRSSS